MGWIFTQSAAERDYIMNSEEVQQMAAMQVQAPRPDSPSLNPRTFAQQPGFAVDRHYVHCAALCPDRGHNGLGPVDVAGRGFN